MPKILFICYGNIARSQIAEGYYNFFTKSKDAISASCDPTTPYRFSGPAKMATEVMREEGVDISKNRVKHVTPEMIEEVQNVYVLNQKDDCPFYVQSSSKTHYWNIDDPFEGSVEKFREVRDAIKKNVKNLL